MAGTLRRQKIGLRISSVRRFYTLPFGFARRRRAPRHLLGGAVEVTDLESEKQLVTLARNLSLFGCFVATATPFHYGNDGQIANHTRGCDSLPKCT